MLSKNGKNLSEVFNKMTDRSHLEVPSSGEAYVSKCAYPGVVHVDDPFLYDSHEAAVSALRIKFGGEVA
jgi:hypothetical protein